VHYVIAFAVVVVPGVFFFLPLLSIFIWPKLKQIMIDIEVTPPAFTVRVFESPIGGTMVHIFFVVVALVMISLAASYVLGPRLQSGSRRVLGSIPDRVAMLLPWRRYRAHRDFTAVLAILLDAGMQETTAVRLAAQASANDVFEARSERVIQSLESGMPLPEALKVIERSEEFQWRWTSALRAGKDFFAALRGWHETLETRAFQREQAAAHVITSSIVLINGALVGSIAVAVFLIMISIIEEGCLW
jgi:type II secretory pathway component PulF